VITACAQWKPTAAHWLVWHAKRSSWAAACRNRP